MLEGFASQWKYFKGYLNLDSDTLSNDAIHIHLGLFIFVFVILLVRRARRGVLLSLCIIGSLSVLNEYADREDWLLWPIVFNWWEPLKDIINTMFWPAVLGWVLLTKIGGDKV